MKKQIFQPWIIGTTIIIITFIGIVIWLLNPPSSFIVPTLPKQPQEITNKIYSKSWIEKLGEKEYNKFFNICANQSSTWEFPDLSPKAKQICIEILEESITRMDEKRKKESHIVNEQIESLR